MGNGNVLGEVLGWLSGMRGSGTIGCGARFMKVWGNLENSMGSVSIRGFKSSKVDIPGFNGELSRGLLKKMLPFANNRIFFYSDSTYRIVPYGKPHTTLESGEWGILDCGKEVYLVASSEGVIYKIKSQLMDRDYFVARIETASPGIALEYIYVGMTKELLVSKKGNQI